MTVERHVITAALLCVFAAAPAAAEVFVYPKQGQSQEQFEKDQFACHSWAKQQTGIDPSQSYAAAPPSTAPQTGGAVRGGARGATVGVIGGAIGGDPGKGAAIGAGVGALAGGARQRSANEQAAAANQQAVAQQQQGLQRYDQAYSACMSGRNYQVK
jgi:YMGG-like Gly-zipper